MTEFFENYIEIYGISQDVWFFTKFTLITVFFSACISHMAIYYLDRAGISVTQQQKKVIRCFISSLVCVHAALFHVLRLSLYL